MMMKDMLHTERYVGNKIFTPPFKPSVQNVLLGVRVLFSWVILVSIRASQYMMTCVICQSNENE